MRHCIELLGGLILGYFLATTAESLWHSHIQHARGSVLRFWRRYPLLFRPLLDAHFSHHVVHHGRTFRSRHTVQFTSESERRQLDASIPERIRGRIQREQYGTTVGGVFGGALYLTPFLPFFAPLLLFGNIWVTVGGVIPFLVCVCLSEFVHPFLHMPHEIALRRASPIVRLVLSTNYMKEVARHHWIHHKHYRSNFNLLLGGDWWRRVMRKPTEAEIERMTEDGLCPPSRRDQLPG